MSHPRFTYKPKDPSMSIHVPSSQQAAVYEQVEHGTGNIQIDAVAGSGKTTTLIEACLRMKGSVAFAAYNKKIAAEIDSRLKGMGAGSNIKAATFHSFGFTAWRRVAPKVKLEEKKVAQICKAMGISERYTPFVLKAVSLAKQHAIGVLTAFDDAAAWQHLVDHYELEDTLSEEGVVLDALTTDCMVQECLDLSRAVLRQSIEQDATIIDFDDMIYAPLVHKCPIWQNDWVLIDEAQDTNPSRRALAKKMLKAGGRLVSVGDPHQAIYGFTGADSDAMDVITREFDARTFPLSVSYRCPRKVVALAQQWVPAITASPTAQDGTVEVITAEKFIALPADQLTAADAILCRNTKPLVELAYHFLRRGIGCHVEGRDIGTGLKALVNRWKARSVTALADKLDEYKNHEVEKLLAKGQEQKADALADRIETLLVICSSLPAGATVNDLRDAIDKLFGDTADGSPSPTLTLSTVHKSKGREWKRVYLYGRNKFMPSPYARQDWQLVQERNLMYVAVTRTLETLIEVAVSK